MNFIDFLNQSNGNLINNFKQITDSETDNNINSTKKTNGKIDNNDIHSKAKIGLYDDCALRDLSVGKTVKIVYLPKSPYNIYKGYIGEIKDYKKQNNYAMVFLNATNEHKIIQLPLKHFILYDNYSTN